MITKQQAELLEKYTYISKVERNGNYIIFHYELKGVNKIKKIPSRSNWKKILETVKQLRQETGVSVYGKGYNSDYYLV